MRVAPLMLLTAWLSLSLTGCALFGKKSNDSAPRPAAVPPGGKGPVQFPVTHDPILQGAGAQANSDAILAGTVIDSFNQNPRDAFIRYVCLEEGKQEEAPIDVAVSPQGFFTIRGVKPGKHYKLIARAKQGEKLIAGITYTKAPDIHLVIRLSENFADGIPAVPGPPAYTPKSEEAKKATSLPPDPASLQSAWNAINKAPVAAGLRLGAPQPLTQPETPLRVPAPPPLPMSPSQQVPPPPMPPAPGPPPLNGEPHSGWVPGVAADKKNWPPLLEIPGNKSPVQIQRPTPLADPPRTPLGPARVPSCVLIGRQLHNLALNDVTGPSWEFRASRKGKLVLFDFWATDCMPCRNAIPHLRDLQARYPALEVIGIACEEGGTPDEQSLRVRAACVRLQCNYRQLLSSGNNCPVKAQFNIRALPTLVLVDESGTILWHQEGLDPASREDLELLIRRQLGVR